MRKLIAGLIVAAAVTGGCGGSNSNGSSSSSGRSDSQVQQDLTSLINSSGPSGATVNECTHQSGNQYVCQVTLSDGTKRFANVTDDGSSIYENGVGPNDQ